MPALVNQKTPWLSAVPFLSRWVDFRRLQRILRDRSEKSVREAWESTGLAFEEVRPVCEAIAIGGGWNSYLFLPNDMILALFFPEGDIGFESIAILRELEKLPLLVDSDVILQLLENPTTLSLGQFIAKLRSLRSQIDSR